MVRRAALALALAGVPGGCAVWNQLPFTTAKADCPAITRASAWINGMPRVGTKVHKLIVAVKLDDDRPWLLTPVESGTGETLVLDLSPGGPAFAGNAGYREPVRQPRREAISITCGGRERARIDEITIAM
jgi:hypothetical protein